MGASLRKARGDMQDDYREPTKSMLAFAWALHLCGAEQLPGYFHHVMCAHQDCRRLPPLLLLPAIPKSSSVRRAGKSSGQEVNCNEVWWSSWVVWSRLR